MINDMLHGHPHEPGLLLARMKALVSACVVLALVYLCSVYGKVGWLSYFLSLPPLSVVILTVIVRINDLPITQQGALWSTRRMGLVLMGMWALSLAVGPLLGAGWPTWRPVIGVWGVALTMITSPHQPPWWAYVSRAASIPAVKNVPLRRASDDFDSNP